MKTHIFAEQCGIMELYCHTYVWQKFRENNVFTKKVTKDLVWRIFFSVTIKLSKEKIREIDSFRIL